MHKDTKARAIPMTVKRAVAERDSCDDWPCCLYCGTPAPPEALWAFSCAHFIPRSQGGLGIEENILTLCPECHRRFDQTTQRSKMIPYFAEYLKTKYPDWDESQLVYRKDME